MGIPSQWLSLYGISLMLAKYCESLRATQELSKKQKSFQKFQTARETKIVVHDMSRRRNPDKHTKLPSRILKSFSIEGEYQR